MKYIIDTEFIDTPTCSCLISLAIVRQDGQHRYFEFKYPVDQLTPWLRQNVVLKLGEKRSTLPQACRSIRDFVGSDQHPEFWAYFGAYDWYWFCRVFGGMMSLPPHWPQRFREFAELRASVEPVGREHHALDDSRSVLQAMKRLGMIP